MKSNPFVVVQILCLTILTLLTSGCKKDDTEGETSPVILQEIVDYGYTYAICKGTFEHNYDPNLLLDEIYFSDITNEPTVSNSNSRRTNIYGDAYIKVVSDAMGQTDFECKFIELENNKTYYFRCAYIKNITDTLYSDAVSITTNLFEINSIEFNPEVTYGQISDVDNNNYKTVEIGTQTWMAENLKTTKFRDGTSITLITNMAEFLVTTDPAYCNFENDAAGSEPLGKLYNWYVIEEENVCPAGWHVATASDWDVLDEYVMQNYQCSGKALASKVGWMEAFWFDCNIGNDFELNNSTGFSAIAAGAFSDNVFGGFGHAGVWWSPKEEGGDYLPSSRYLTRDNSSLGLNSSEAENKGYPVRCVKD